MSALANVLRHITKKASHPNALIHQIQLERARSKYLVQGRLGDGLEGVVSLDAPKGDGVVKFETEKSSKEEGLVMQKDVEGDGRGHEDVESVESEKEVTKDGGSH